MFKDPRTKFIRKIFLHEQSSNLCNTLLALRTHTHPQNQQKRGQQKEIAKTTNPQFDNFTNQPIIVEVFIVIYYGAQQYTKQVVTRAMFWRYMSRIANLTADTECTRKMLASGNLRHLVGDLAYTLTKKETRKKSSFCFCAV